MFCRVLPPPSSSPHRFTEKGNLEVLLFTIQSKMRANNQKVYMPREGKLISDINKVNVTIGYNTISSVSLSAYICTICSFSQVVYCPSYDLTCVLCAVIG